jgi:hypothetical protein
MTVRKHTPTIRHRGYLYAQGRWVQPIRVTPEEVTKERMKIADDWRNGYLAALHDVRRRGKT